VNSKKSILIKWRKKKLFKKRKKKTKDEQYKCIG